MLLMDKNLFHSNNRPLFDDCLSSLLLLSNLGQMLNVLRDIVVNVVIQMDWRVMYRADDSIVSDQLVEKVIDLPKAKWLHIDVVE